MTAGVTRVIGGILLGAFALPVLACELPALPIIPAADQLGDRAPAVNAATSAYFDGIKTYAGCIEGTLTTAGGESAAASVKSVLLARSQAAVAEAAAIQELYQERVAAGTTASPGTEAALRKLVEGVATGMPDYTLFTPEMERLTRQQLGNLQRNAVALGAITSLEFRGVTPQGWDSFEVHGEGGTMPARIHLDAAGKVDGAFLQPTLKAGERRPTATIPRRH